MIGAREIEEYENEIERLNEQAEEEARDRSLRQATLSERIDMLVADLVMLSNWSRTEHDDFIADFCANLMDRARKISAEIHDL